jgi:hypothetical protein
MVHSRNMEEKDLMVERPRILNQDEVKTPLCSLPAPENYFVEPYPEVSSNGLGGSRCMGRSQIHLFAMLATSSFTFLFF